MRPFKAQAPSARRFFHDAFVELLKPCILGDPSASVDFPCSHVIIIKENFALHGLCAAN